MEGRSPYLDANVARTYARFAAPAQFARPAQDLVELLDIPIGAHVLDVGTGTGVVARAMAARIGAAGRVAGVDASIEMLRAGACDRRHPVLVARVPDLPFRNAAFDAVAASFVITHVDSYVDGLAELVRVCRSGGRIGVTTWGTLPNPAGALWKDVASTFGVGQQLADAFRRAIPWDEWLSTAANLADALRAARVSDVNVVTREFVIRIPALDYVAMKNATVEGTLLRALLSRTDWDRFVQHVTAALQTRFGDVVSYRRDFHVGIGATGGRGTQP